MTCDFTLVFLTCYFPVAVQTKQKNEWMCSPGMAEQHPAINGALYDLVLGGGACKKRHGFSTSDQKCHVNLVFFFKNKLN